MGGLPIFSCIPQFLQRYSFNWRSFTSLVRFITRFSWVGVSPWSFSACLCWYTYIYIYIESLLVFAIWLWTLPLCWNHWWFPEVFSCNFGDHLHITSSANRDDFTHFYPFDFLLSGCFSARAILLKRNGDSEQSCLVSDLNRVVWVFFPFCINIGCVFVMDYLDYAEVHFLQSYTL